MPYVSAKRRAAAVIVLLALQEKKKRRRSCWTKKWLLKRETLSNMDLLQELRDQSPESFRNQIGMSEACFTAILAAVAPLIQRQDTVMRKSICPEQRLIATLRYVATGRSFEDLKFTTGISAQALGSIIPETCYAIVEALRGQYLKFPKTPEQWRRTAKKFNDYWNFPNCGGVIGGKHVRIKPPPNSGSYYLNYKGYFSIILLAIVNANYEFTMVDIGKNGRVTDSGIIEQTTFYQKLKDNRLHLPQNSETNEGLNFVFIGDEPFGLHENLLKPFTQEELTPEGEVFNFRLSRARQVFENAFGVMSNRFRIFQTSINLSPEKIDIILLACCVLHNFLKRNNQNAYIPVGMLDQEDIETGGIIPGEWRNDNRLLHDLQNLENCDTTADANMNRDKYMEYFSGVGKIDQHIDMM